ncbi:DUF4082 domain-containing protein [Jiangella asiatica]|uniref:DUF4082 domain-containing protein n=1 Tax=Jiangella asiatica TaxID=2530372 RepID=A0A4R5DND6_9ACTN|nr:DUF4082 domain-containing protein [Jiangella asiatica]TDE15836.1 hypothetical protein E1269_00625 [Jiangella asiatica]
MTPGTHRPHRRPGHTTSSRRLLSALVAAGAVLATLAGTTPVGAATTSGPATATAAASTAGWSVEQDEGAGTVTMCGERYCAVLDVDGGAVVRSLTVDGHEQLDHARGLHSSLTADGGEVTSLELAADPEVAVDGATVEVRFTTELAAESWTFAVSADALDFTLRRTYAADTSLIEQGTPALTFADGAVEQIRWPGDGGNFPVGGHLVDSYQESWLAGGDNLDTNIRTSKEQVSFDLLSATTETALTVTGRTARDGVDSGRATELWRSGEDAGAVLNAAVATAAGGLRYAGPNPLGYGYQTTKDGSPVFQPVPVTAGQVDEVTLELGVADHEDYYDLGELEGVDEDALSAAVNDYARWMMQDVDKGASTEQPQLQSEVPPLEMHWIGQLLELFPEAGSIGAFQAGLEDIRDHLIEPSGRVICCYPGFGSTWGHDYGDQVSGYALGVAKAYELSGDGDWLASMEQSVDRALDHLVTRWTEPATRFVRNVKPDLSEADYDNDYWESSTGEFNGYTTVLLYDALTRWAELEREVLGDEARAGELTALADTIRTHFNRDVADGGFWSPETNTFLYGTGNQDALYLPVNAAVLKTDITDRDRMLAIVRAIEAHNAEHNHDLHPMNVRDLYVEDAIARTAGKGGENGGWYGAPDGDYYAGLPLLDDPQVLQTAVASFLLRYQADGFHGATAWDRDNPLSSTASGVWFPTTVMPAWGLYHYGYGLQPEHDRLVLAPYLTDAMSGSSVHYTWRQVPLTVTYADPLSYQISVRGELPTPVTVRWQNQTPGEEYRVLLGPGRARTVTADAAGTVEAELPAGSRGPLWARCLTCTAPETADPSGSGPAVEDYDADGAPLRSDGYDQVGMRVAVGPHPVEVTSLGRFKAEGNEDVHRVKIVDVEGRIVASAAVDLSGRPDADGFVSAALSEPVTLRPGLYYVVSSETRGGDAWHDAGGTVTAGDGVTVLGAVSGRDFAVAAEGATAFGPVTFGYRQVGDEEPWIQALAEPRSVRARSGEEITFDVTVWGQAADGVDGTVAARLPAGWSAEPVPFTVPTEGEPASVTVPVTVRVAPDAPTADVPLAFTATGPDGLTSSRTVTVSVANLLYDFDDGTTQGWQGGPGVVSVRAVPSTANGPGVPYAGSHLLEFDGGPMIGADPRTISVEPAEPLDLSAASTVYAHVNSWGAWPLTPDSYEVTVTLHSGTESISATTEYEANVWNRATVDVSGWEHRDEVTRIDVTYVVNVDGENYRLYFDLDSVGYDT